MIAFEHVTKILGGREVLRDFNLEIPKREIFFIIGTSGAGKSVTLKHMVRLLTPDEGRIIIDGEVISEARDDDLERLRRRFGFLFQSGALLQWLNVEANVGLPLREKTNMSEDEIAERVQKTLDLLSLGDALQKYPTDLSGGMRKRVGLARAVITEPEIVLYDEPTSGLDPVTSRSIDELIVKMRDDLDVTSVVVTHDLHSALSIGTQIAMLDDGQLVEQAAPDDFVNSSHPKVQQFLESQFITKEGSW